MGKFTHTVMYLTAAAVIFIFTTFATQAYVREYVGLRIEVMCQKVDYIIKTVDEIKSELNKQRR
jgi:low affinity Fe/Cu permease